VSRTTISTISDIPNPPPRFGQITYELKVGIALAEVQPLGKNIISASSDRPYYIHI